MLYTLHTSAQGYTCCTRCTWLHRQHTAVHGCTQLYMPDHWPAMGSLAVHDWGSENRKLFLNLSLSLSSYVTLGNFLNLCLPQFSSSENQSMKNLLAVRIKGDLSLKRLAVWLALRRCLKKFSSHWGSSLLSFLSFSLFLIFARAFVTLSQAQLADYLWNRKSHSPKYRWGLWYSI